MDTERDVLSLLNHVADGTIPPEDALLQFRLSPFGDLGYAKVDHHRGLRQRVPEVIYGQSRTPEQITGILGTLRLRGCKNILVTHITREAANLIAKDAGITYEPLAKLAIVFPEETEKHGPIVVATGGTSNTSVTEKAALTAEALGNSMTRVYDVGVTGLHRLPGNLKPLMTAQVVIAVVGIEGALASVTGGLVDRPVIAVPTSVGCGASFGEAAALLSMLNSCAPGVNMVNIDNGFGAGYLASQINHMGEPARRSVPWTSEITRLYISECMTERVAITPAGVLAALLFTHKNLFERLVFRALE